MTGEVYDLLFSFQKFIDIDREYPPECQINVGQHAKRHANQRVLQPGQKAAGYGDTDTDERVANDRVSPGWKGIPVGYLLTEVEEHHAGDRQHAESRPVQVTQDGVPDHIGENQQPHTNQ